MEWSSLTTHAGCGVHQMTCLLREDQGIRQGLRQQIEHQILAAQDGVMVQLAGVFQGRLCRQPDTSYYYLTCIVMTIQCYPYALLSS